MTRDKIIENHIDGYIEYLKEKQREEEYKKDPNLPSKEEKNGHFRYNQRRFEYDYEEDFYEPEYDDEEDL